MICGREKIRFFLNTEGTSEESTENTEGMVLFHSGRISNGTQSHILHFSILHFPFGLSSETLGSKKMENYTFV
jgi:ATP adenylyltransferase/5',5'''-P-1,P-4-tetraphosphate phosphorylase II